MAAIRPDFTIFAAMHGTNISGILVEKNVIRSESLGRDVKVDCYLPYNISDPSQLSLLLINDGQNMEEMEFASILEQLYVDNTLEPLLCVAIHAGDQRKMEYGIAAETDYLGRGARAAAYTSFVIKEILPFVYQQYRVSHFKQKAFAGFSLGGLSALDIVWNHPGIFNTAGVFSGSLWWRSVDQDDEQYDDDKHRIMHQRVRNGNYQPGLKFFLQCGNRDETWDRNKNGVIDSIDDTRDLVNELAAKGYDENNDIFYLEMPDGSHDIATWGKAVPVFLKWLSGK